ncbi:hypothetical protein [Veillonella sp.]|uniref:hypothetical protein n=1 Tax=Veillonella sp. TaxID=1926307 RepID=UPI0025D7F747|nr:hypothetical protein [Veillonella sp.]
MKQACIKLAVLMAISAPVWGLVSEVSAVDSVMPQTVQQEQLNMARQRAEARDERNRTERVEIEGIPTSMAEEQAVDEGGPSFLLPILN